MSAILLLLRPIIPHSPCTSNITSQPRGCAEKKPFLFCFLQKKLELWFWFIWASKPFMPSLQNLLFSVRHWISHGNVIDVMFEPFLIQHELWKTFFTALPKKTLPPPCQSWYDHDVICYRAPNSSARKRQKPRGLIFWDGVEVAERNCWPFVIFQFPCNFTPPPPLAQNINL